jgi:hypothetical protein
MKIATLEKIQRALEAGGIEFLQDLSYFPIAEWGFLGSFLIVPHPALDQSRHFLKLLAALEPHARSFGAVIFEQPLKWDFLDPRRHDPSSRSGRSRAPGSGRRHRESRPAQIWCRMPKSDVDLAELREMGRKGSAMHN